jgi:Asp-tRNA(Asn)/Glu-tRNA(Gln) amidotransferase B subunit
MQASGSLTATQAKEVLAEVEASGGDPDQVVRSRGYEAMGSEALAAVVDGIIASHPQEWERYRAGEAKLTGFFVGKAMEATGRRANGGEVTALLRRRAGSA